MHTRKCTRTVHACIYMKCLQQTPARTSLLSTNFDLLWVIICFNNPQIGNKITIKLRFRMVFQNKIRHKCVYTVLYSLYGSDTCSVACLTAALHGLCWHATFSWHLLYSVVHYIYILYMHVLQLIINSTMYTIVPVWVLFCNFGNVNAVYMYFYPD